MRRRCRAGRLGIRIKGADADMDKLGIGIAGCGAGVWMHGPAIQVHDGAQPVAWMDIDREAAQRAADRFGGAVYGDFDAFLDSGGLDAVIIATPNSTHCSQTLKALGKGKHVLCEKPMGRTMAECGKMLDFSTGKEMVLMVGFMKRFDPALMMVNDMIKAGEIGEVYEISCDWGWPQYFPAGQRDRRINGGGLLIDHGSHSIDLARWWGGNIRSVYANVKIVLRGRQVDDYSCTVCRHESGCVSIHNHSRLTHRGLHENYKIEGAKGCITIQCENQWSARLTYPYTVRLHTRTKGIGSGCTNISPEPAGDAADQVKMENRYSRQLRCFVDSAVTGGKLSCCTAEDGYAAVEAVNAAYISADEDRCVPLPLDNEYDFTRIFRSLLHKQQIRVDRRGDTK